MITDTVSVCVYARVLHNKYTNLTERHRAMRIYSNPPQQQEEEIRP